MHKLEEGILPQSELYFLQHDDFAAQTLYQIQHIGVFYCDARYVVTHPYWESILLIFIDAGELEVELPHEHFVAAPGMAVLIDCRFEHRYRARDGLKFHYFHFAGPESRAYAEHIRMLAGRSFIQVRERTMTEQLFYNILRLAKAGNVHTKSEYRMSAYVEMILCELVEACTRAAPVTNEWMERAILFMEENLMRNVPLDEIAQQIGVSKFYFSRCFREQMGMTPHQYFLNMRVQHAKKLLVTTHDSVERIAADCGFDTASNFIRVFKHKAGMTPTAFRKIPF